MNLKINIYHSFDETLASVWFRLQSDCASYLFQRFDWLAYWYRTIGQHSYAIEPVVVVVSDSKGPFALYPFGIRKFGGIKVLEFLGGLQSDYNVPLILPGRISQEHLSEFWDDILGYLPAHDVRYFTRMPELLGASRNVFLDIVPSFFDGKAYSANLPKSWELFQQRLSKRFRKDNARMIRRLSEMGQLEFVVAKTSLEFTRIVDALLIQKERRYKETGARNILEDIHTRSFYRELTGAVGGDARVHISALILNDEVLAAHLGTIYNGRFYYLFPAFVGGKWKKFSPGRLLLEHLIKLAIGDHLRIFDFTVGGELYKDIWCDSEMTLYRAIEPLNFRGRLFAWLQKLIYWVKGNPHARSFAMRMLRIFQHN